MNKWKSKYHVNLSQCNINSMQFGERGKLKEVGNVFPFFFFSGTK